MKLMAGSERIIADDETDPFDGDVRWHPAKSLWIGTMTLLAVVLGPLFFSWSALILFMATSAVTLCFGHSVGMHRRLIQLRLSVMARAFLRLSRHPGRDGRPLRHGAAARFSRLGAASVELP
jgi:hypothetical protein